MRWICDEANGLGEREDETYLVGSYDEESEIIEQGDVANLQAALGWCEAASSNSKKV
jgi:hypothetical protein